jgi:hypothetical protein
MIRWDAVFQPHVTEKTFRPLIFPAHHLPQPKGITHM